MAPKTSTKVAAISGPKPRHAVKKKTQVQSASLAALQKTQNIQVKEYSAVNNTDRAYGGHVNRGKKFLGTVVAEKMQRVEDVCAEGIVSEELAKAFDKPLWKCDEFHSRRTPCFKFRLLFYDFRFFFFLFIQSESFTKSRECARRGVNRKIARNHYFKSTGGCTLLQQVKGQHYVIDCRLALSTRL